MGVVLGHDGQGAVAAMVERRSAVEILAFTEIGKDRDRIPAGVARVGPGVVVSAVATGVDHGVEAAAAAQQSAARPGNDPAGAVWLRHRLVAPIQLSANQARQSVGIGNIGMIVRAARFEEQDTGPIDFAEPIGQDTTSGASADDDEIVAFHTRQGK